MLRMFSGLGQRTVVFYTILKSSTHEVIRFFGLMVQFDKLSVYPGNPGSDL